MIVIETKNGKINIKNKIINEVSIASTKLYKLMKKMTIYLKGNAKKKVEKMEKCKHRRKLGR